MMSQMGVPVYWPSLDHVEYEKPLSWVISHVPIFHITQPLGINGLLDGYYKVMSNIPKSWDISQPLFYDGRPST